MDKQRKYIRDGRAPIPESEATSRVMSANKGKNTKPEMALRKALFRKKPGYRLHWEKVPGRPDICYPGKKIAVFVNGCFWHRCPYCDPPMPKPNIEFWEKKFSNNTKRDKRKTEELEAIGWTVLFIWECQINDNVDLCVEKISSFIQEIDETKHNTYSWSNQ